MKRVVHSRPVTRFPYRLTRLTVVGMSDDLAALLVRQDALLTRAQALQHFTRHAVEHRLGDRWQVVLPGVYATFTGPLMPRQRSRAAILFAGPGAMLSDHAVIAMHGGRFLPRDECVDVLVPHENQTASRDFVRIRRTRRPPRSIEFAGLPTAPLARSLVEFGIRVRDERRDVRAVLADCVQRHLVTPGELLTIVEVTRARGSGLIRAVVEELCAGVRSAPEGDLRALILTSSVLPAPLWNPLIRLPNGVLISPDALIVDSGVVQEVNGRLAHADEDRFESMQERHGVMTAAGLEVLHASPRQITHRGAAVLERLEICHQRRAGRGLPPGVVILRPGPPG